MWHECKIFPYCRFLERMFNNSSCLITSTRLQWRSWTKLDIGGRMWTNANAWSMRTVSKGRIRTADAKDVSKSNGSGRRTGKISRKADGGGRRTKANEVRLASPAPNDQFYEAYGMLYIQYIPSCDKSPSFTAWVISKYLLYFLTSQFWTHRTIFFKCSWKIQNF